MTSSSTFRTSILLFGVAGDNIQCVKIEPQVGHACQLCGRDVTDFAITIMNPRTGRKLIACPMCAHQCGEATGQPIVYPKVYANIVDAINERWPGHAVVDSEKARGSQHWSDDDLRVIINEVFYTFPYEERVPTGVADWAPEGLDPADFDWESFDYEA